MKLFRVKGCDIVAAKSMKECMDFYEDMSGEGNSIAFEIPEEEWETQTVQTDESDENGLIVFTLKEWVQQFSEDELPLIVASTEC